MLFFKGALIDCLGPCRAVDAGGRASAMKPRTAGSSCSCTCRAARSLHRMRPPAQPCSATCCVSLPPACWIGCSNTRSNPSPYLPLPHLPLPFPLALPSPLRTHKYMLYLCISAVLLYSCCLLYPLDTRQPMLHACTSAVCYTAVASPSLRTHTSTCFTPATVRSAIQLLSPSRCSVHVWDVQDVDNQEENVSGSMPSQEPGDLPVVPMSPQDRQTLLSRAPADIAPALKAAADSINNTTDAQVCASPAMTNIGGRLLFCSADLTYVA